MTRNRGLLLRVEVDSRLHGEKEGICMQVGRRGFLRIAAAVLLLTASLILPAGAGWPVTITFWHGMSGVLNPAIDELTNDFNKLNPGIAVQALYQGGYRTLNQKLIAAVAAGQPPTITQLFSNS